MTHTAEQLDWLKVHELTKPEYLAEARATAIRLLETHDSITVNDVRELCPPPSSMDPRVMGAIFRTADFEATGEFVLSSRSTCHKRPIQKFRRAA